MHPWDADSYYTSDVFTAAAAAADVRDLTMDSASDAVAHQSTTDYTLNATVATRPIDRLIRTNGNTFLIFYEPFTSSETLRLHYNHLRLDSAFSPKIMVFNVYKLY